MHHPRKSFHTEAFVTTIGFIRSKRLMGRTFDSNMERQIKLYDYFEEPMIIKLTNYIEL